MSELQSYLPALGFPGRGVEFALFWTADDDPDMNLPVFVGSPLITVKWADYNLSRNPGQSFVDYLNQVNTVLFPGELEGDVSVDVMRYIANRIDMSPQDSMDLIVRPPGGNSVEYQELVARPGEVFMLLLYVEKHLSYHFVSRHPDFMSSLGEIDAARSEDRFSSEWFDEWWAKAEPLQMKLVANNSDRGFSGLVSDLDQAMVGILPDDLRVKGVSNLKELADIRNTIGHSTIYNGMVVDGRVIISPHITKHTARFNRETLTTHFDDETFGLIKSMIEDAHTFAGDLRQSLATRVWRHALSTRRQGASGAGVPRAVFGVCPSSKLRVFEVPAFRLFGPGGGGYLQPSGLPGCDFRPPIASKCWGHHACRPVSRDEGGQFDIRI